MTNFRFMANDVIDTSEAVAAINKIAGERTASN
jgi:hypothetical protein